MDKLCDHVLVDTGQNYDLTLRDIFLEQLAIRKPNYCLNAVGSVGEQIAKMMPPLEAIILEEKPDAFLVLGDTNSSLGAIMAKRLGIRVFHMEAGNRCFDDKVPEEVNRRIIDHSSDILMPYTERSRQNLLDEGIHSSKIYVTGNPIYEVLNRQHENIANSTILRDYSLNPTNFYLITLHREENVDNPSRLYRFVDAFNRLDKPAIWPVHPRSHKKLRAIKMNPNVIITPPLGLFDFVRLEKNAYCVLTDSGTVQEECAIFAVPVVTLRDSTERPETMESGSNFISGCEPEAILRGIQVATQDGQRQAPSEYFVENVSDTVVRIVLGFWK